MIDYQSFADAWPDATQLLRPPLERWVSLTQAYEAAPPDGLLVALGSRWHRAVCVETSATAEGYVIPDRDLELARGDGIPLMVMVREADTGLVLAAPLQELPQVGRDESGPVYPRDAFWQLSTTSPGVTS